MSNHLVSDDISATYCRPQFVLSAHEKNALNDMIPPKEIY